MSDVQRQLAAAGRPRNPYTSANHWFEPRGTRDWFGPVADLALPPPAPASFRERDIRWEAYGLLMQIGLPTPRRVVESILVFEHGFEPEAVTKALNRLPHEDYIGGRDIELTEIPSRGSKPQMIFSFKRRPTDAELGYLTKAIANRDRVLSIGVLRDAGERYTRDVLVKSGRYENITQEQRLGQVVNADDEHALDLVAVDRLTGVRFGISVKNQREWLKRGATAIKDCFTKAKAHGVHPWLVVPFATDEARERCKRDGIKLTVLGRQMVPALTGGHRMQNFIRDSRYVIGPQPFDYLYERASETFERSDAARADVMKVIDPAVAA